MAQNIILKRSALPGKVPDTASLNIGEIAVNTYDGKLFIKRSGNTDSIQSIVTTDSITTGSIQLTQTGSFGEIVVSQDVNLQRDIFVGRDIITIGDIDAGGDISGSGLQINDTLNITHGLFSLSASAELTGSLGIDGDLTVLGTVNARQFNISVISSSILFESGSSNFGNSSDDIHTFTGSVDITGSLIVNGSEVGIAPGPNTFDFNLDPEAAGTVNFIQDSTTNTQAITRTGSFDIEINGTNYLSVSSSAINVTTGSITANYMHLAKYITTSGDLDFNI
jgi:hypothetical protein